MLHITKDNFEKEVKESKIPVIIDFYADWCMPCKMMGPVFEKLSKDFDKKVKFAKVNTEDESDLSQEFEIMSIPCLVVFKNGKELNRILGFMPEDALKEKINALL
jgi:thioredoxin 1